MKRKEKGWGEKRRDDIEEERAKRKERKIKKMKRENRTEEIEH